MITIDEYKDRGFNRKEIRSYELSLWTLQDEFITVLKWSDIELKGRVENPHCVLDIDGTENLTFSVPMYYRENGKLVENPNWYNIRNENTMISMRKVKLILNKGEPKIEKVYEFEIIDVLETHEKDVLTCEVTCEGLAFHELGKIGYRYKLSQDEFIEDYKKWQDLGMEEGKMPIQNLNYWCEKINLVPYPEEGKPIKSNIWYYKVNMNWKPFGGFEQRDDTKLYEEGYVSDWDDNLVPTQTVSFLEKARPVSVENSNIYNITQTIAETFQCFCRYEYGHDLNYNITSRVVVFYNNFLLEEEGVKTLSYPYSATKVSRKMEGSSLTTKLFVESIDADNYDSSFTIANADANPTRENYILNFDYMYNNGNLTEELYEQIPIFNKKIARINNEITRLSNNLSAFLLRKPELEARIKILLNTRDTALELIGLLKELQNAITEKYGSQTGEGYIVVDNTRPDLRVLITRDGLSYINVESILGIVASSIQVWKTYHSNTATLETEITGFGIQYDEDNHNIVKRLTNFVAPGTNESSMRYLTYKYNPYLYYESVIRDWYEKYNGAVSELDEKEKELGKEPDSQGEGGSGLLKDIYDTQKQIDILLDKKEELLCWFERTMGPAIREGYWLPEEYRDSGKRLQTVKTLRTTPENNENIYLTTDDTHEDFEIGWDTTLFDGEDKLYYEMGITKRKVVYPCINLNKVSNLNLSAIKDYSFIYNNNLVDHTQANADDLKNLTIMAIGSQALLRFIKTNNGIVPALILIGAKNLSLDLLKRMITPGIASGNPRLGKIINDDTPNLVINYHVSDAINIPSTAWIYTGVVDNEYQTLKPEKEYENTIIPDYVIIEEDAAKIVYPRARLSSLALKKETDDIYVAIDKTKINMYSDYYLTTRTVSRDESGSINYYVENFLTIKPEVLIYNISALDWDISIDYILSNANTCIYLDALEVSRENAYPKVSYEITLNNLDTDLHKILYAKLAQVMMINDTDLKLLNTFGYISNIDMDLDNVANDTVEVKNYKTKFEDLFSTIVALTESMKRASTGLSAAISGSIPMNELSFSEMLNSEDSGGYRSVLDAYLDSHFDSSLVVIDRLTELFTEAGLILSSASSTLQDVNALTIKNASILGNFATDVAKELNATVTRGQTCPTTFKPGDIWIETDKDNNVISRYVATVDSSTSLLFGYNDSSFNGFTRTYDGTLASIKGYGLEVDAVAGTIDIKAENKVSLRSGKHVYIAAGDSVDIVGNKAVNIGGTTINIAADDNGSLVGGINLVSSSAGISSYINLPLDFPVWQAGHNYEENDEIKVKLLNDDNYSYYRCKDSHKSGDTFVVGLNWDRFYPIEEKLYNAIESSDTSISKILINPKKIEMGSADILMRGANSILMITSRGSFSNTSALSISPSTGVWIGSGLGVTLYSGNVTILYDKGLKLYKVSDNSLGASVELLPSHLLMGVSNGSTGTAIELTDEQMIIAAGNTLSYDPWKAGTLYSIGASVLYNNLHYRCIVNQSNTSWNAELWAVVLVTGTSTGLVGARFTQESIGFATGSGSNINAILMNDNGITIGGGSIDVTLDSATLRDYTENNLGKSIGSVTNGSYTRISSKGIELGSLADLYINTDNFKLLTHSRDRNNTDYEDGDTILAIGRGLQNINYDTTIEDIRELAEAALNPLDVRLVLNKDGAYFKGDIYANDGYFNGTVNATTFKAHGTNTYMKVNDTDFGFYKKSNNTPLLTIDSSGHITASNLYITADSLFIGTTTNATSLQSLFTTFTTSINNALNTANGAQTYASQIADGTISVPHVKTTGIEIKTYEDTSTNPATTKGIINIESTGKINLAANSSLTMMNSASNSAIILNQDGITVATHGSIVVESGGTINMNATNLTIKSNPASGENFFYVGGTTNGINRYIKYTSSGSLEIKGKIIADEGSLGKWILTDDWLYGGVLNKCVTLVGPLSDDKTYNIGNFNQVNLNKWAMYAGANWPELPHTTDTTLNRTPYGWAPFRVARNGTVYAKELCIGNGPSYYGENVPYEDPEDTWADYTGHLWFWIKGWDVDKNNNTVSTNPYYQWIKLDGLALYNAIYDVEELWKAIAELRTGLLTVAAAASTSVTVSSTSVTTSSNPNATKTNPTSGCFVKGTRILLINGEFISIEKLLLGMQVLSYDLETCLLLPGEVVAVQALKHKYEIYDIILSNNKKITLTPCHPLLTTDGWKAIDTERALSEHKVKTTLIKKGDELITSDLEKVYILDIIRRYDLTDETVYNCCIEDYHTFTVENIIVHNAFVAATLK